jgi:cell division septum initiation protein DivIVA
MRAEIQRLRQEVDALKQELKTSSDVVQEFPLVQAQVQEQAQTKVETSS